MTPERWRRIERLHLEARVLARDEREPFLARACFGDESLRHDVDALLEGDDLSARWAASNASTRVEEDAVASSFSALPNSSDSVSPSTLVLTHHAAVMGVEASLPVWARVVVFIALSHIVAFLAFYFSGTPADYGALPVPAWIYGGLASVFGLCGIGLVFGHRGDSRAAWLGAIFVLMGAPLALKLYIGDSVAVPWIVRVRPEAFVGVFFWEFLIRFPSRLEGRAARFARGVATAALIVAIWCAVPSLQVFVASRVAIPAWASLLFAMPAWSVNWLLVTITAAAGFPFLLWRASIVSGERRQRIARFAMGWLIGVAPFTIEVLLEEAWPAYKRLIQRPSIEPWVGAVIFGALGFVPILTAYSVLFDRVVETRAVVRAAIQHALARYTIVVATLVPFAALAVFVITHREESLTALVTGVRPVVLLSATVAGALALRLRTQWLGDLDRRYFRESYDSEDILSSFLSSSRVASVGELGTRLRAEIDRVLHARAELFVADEELTMLRHVHEQLPALSVASTLARLAHADPSPMRVDLGVFSRLPEDERRWIREGDFAMVIPLRHAEGPLTGLLALSEKLSSLPYSSADRRLLSAMVAAASLVIDSLRPGRHDEPVAELPAKECSQCSRIHPSETMRCVCGGDVKDGAVPHHFRGVFLLKERIGHGGMGVVYRAVDVNLRRDVAIKALPRTTPRDVARLRREARSMAAVTHPNLAIIHGVETWRGLPFLVEEYLGGGTLAARVAARRLPLDEVLDIGITLADLLQHLHGVGIIHCDIKPTNVGFTREGIMKVLDFGLARVLKQAPAVDSSTEERSQVAGGGWFGTPRYMSPEAARGEQAAPAFDLWASSVLLYECFSGRVPFDGQNADTILQRVVSETAPDIRKWQPDAPEAFATFLNGALSRDPAKRPVDAAALATALRRLRQLG